MKPIKFVLLACAALAILLVFALPYISIGEGLEFSLWKLREDIAHPYIILGAMALPTAFGALAVKTERLPRWQSILSTVCFAIALFIAFAVFSKTQTQFGDHGGLGAKLMVVALLGGGVASIAGVVKPERS